MSHCRLLIFLLLTGGLHLTAGLTQPPAGEIVLISAVQGAGERSPLAGEQVSIEAVVTASFQGDGRAGLGGVFVQEQDVDTDSDPATSEGLWVFQGDEGVPAAVGDLVLVSGEVSEFDGLTQIDVRGPGSGFEVLGTAPLPTPTALDLPRSDSSYEAHEGMLVTLSGESVITDVANLDRFGSITVVDGQRLVEFTECNEPSEDGLRTYDSLVAARSLVVDDGRAAQDLPPLLAGIDLAAARGELRAGNTLGTITGVLDERYTGYRLQATSITGIEQTNARPTSVPDLAGEVRVASINVLNYFNGDGDGGGFPTARGAETPEAFARQEAKLVAAICALQADVLALMEVENDGYGARSSIRRLSTAVASACDLDYEVVVAPESGSDDIRVAMLYRPDLLAEQGSAASLTEPPETFRLNRVPLAASFIVIDSTNLSVGQTFTAVVTHLRSKGGNCADTDIAGDDASDGSGSCDGTRTAAAVAILDWLAGVPTSVQDPDLLVLGDLNAYRRERPVQTFIDAGYVNTVVEAQPPTAFPCGGSATYVYRGRWGSLDHALASSSLAPQVTGADTWSVNAAEPDALAYDNAALAVEDFYRFSDHDPVVVGLSLRGEEPTAATTASLASVREGRLASLGGRRFRLVNATEQAAYSLLDSTGQRYPVTLDSEGGFRIPSEWPGGVYFLRARSARGAVDAYQLFTE